MHTARRIKTRQAMKKRNMNLADEMFPRLRLPAIRVIQRQASGTVKDSIEKKKKRVVAQLSVFGNVYLALQLSRYEENYRHGQRHQC